MQRLGVKGFVRKQKRPNFQGEEHDRFPNILNRCFSAEKPMQKIVTDVTYISHKGKWYYFACYLDLFNNEILDWELSDTFDNFLVMNPAKRILEKTKSTGTQIRVFSTLRQVIVTCLNLTIQFKVCQEQEHQETMPLLNLSLGDLKMLCVHISSTGNVMTYTKLLQILFIILIT